MSVTLLVAICSYLVLQLLRSEDAAAPPRATLDLARVAQSGGAYVVPVVVENPGESSVRQLRISVVPTAAVCDRGRIRDIDYLTAHTRRELSFLFDEDPKRLGLRVFVESFEAR